MMQPGGGKNKGSSFERKIGEKISLWLSAGQRKDLMCRTVGSGAQFTSAFNRGQQAGLAGDLRSQDPIAEQLCSRFVIECKHWKNLEMINFLHAEGELYKALAKVKQEGKTVSKSWMLVAKQNNRPELLFIPSNFYSVEVSNAIKVAEVGATIDNLTAPVTHCLFGGSVLMYFLDEFFGAVKPEDFLK